MKIKGISLNGVPRSELWGTPMVRGPLDSKYDTFELGNSAFIIYSKMNQGRDKIFSAYTMGLWMDACFFFFYINIL